MASSNMGEFVEDTPDFYEILNDVDVEVIVKTELEECMEVKYSGTSDCIDEEEELEDIIEVEDDSDAEMAPETEAYFESESATVLAMWNEDLDPLPMTSTSTPLRKDPDTSAAVGSGSSEREELSTSNIVVTVPLDDDIAIEEDHVFHLASEHQLFQQPEEVATEQPQQQCHARRGGPARRCRTRGLRGGRPGGDSQWVKGERLIEVHINDDDVPEALRESIRRIVTMREAARVRVSNRTRSLREENEEEWMDADGDEIESFFVAEGTSSHFEWSPMGDYQGKREKFLPQQTGPVVASEHAYGAFRQYWDDGIMSHIVTETNRYAAGLAGSSANFARDWYDTNIHEIFVLFSFWMMLGIIRMPTIKSCFTINPLLQTNIFRKMFNRTRYESLCRALHLNDNSNRPTDSSDLLFSLGPILDHLNARFQETYIPSQNICIDESLTLWKGNLAFRQYIKTKAARFGLKTFELCESSTGYLWSFFVYLGAGTSYDSGFPSSVLKSTHTVGKLIRPLLDKGYTLFMDNWFNSPLLARFLKTRKTDCVGTLRTNCRNVPPLISQCNLKDGQFVARHSGDVVVLAFQDKKRKIATISTYHGNSQGQMEAKPHRSAQYKPQIVLDYNKSMGGVDRKDQMLEPYVLERKRGAKWNIKFFKHLLNCSILNARIHLQRSLAAPKEQLVFRLELVDQILRHHNGLVPKITTTYPVSSGPSHLQPRMQHFPKLTDLYANGHHSRRRCFWCSKHKKTKRTIHVCSVCEVPLCTDPCFELYHTKF